MSFISTKIIELGSCAFRQPRAIHSHCKFIHGYRLQAKFWFSASSLDERNWVVDFGDLKDLKSVLQKQFDHTLCIAGDDPLLEYFEKLHSLGGCDLRVMPGGVGIERTAEWCYQAADSLIKQKTSGRCRCVRVEVWEHEQNSAIYEGLVEPVLNGTREATEPTTSTPASTQPPTAVSPQNNKTTIPAKVGNTVSSGWSNPFAGTTWGTDRPGSAI